MRHRRHRRPREPCARSLCLGQQVKGQAAPFDPVHQQIQPVQARNEGKGACPRFQRMTF
ncbi:hypothetical protein J7363_12815 [Phaeobacter italicus]|nr:hypothetical protein [Phaeobacter italicus]